MTEQISEGQQAILSQIVPIVVEKLGVDPAEVTMVAQFTNDLGADSLDTVELMMEFEKEYHLSIPDDQQEELQTVGDVVRFIKKMRDDPNWVPPKKPSPQSAPKVVKPHIKEKNPATPKTQSASKGASSKETVAKYPRVETTPQNVSGDPFKTTVGELLEMPVEQALNLFNQIRAQMTLRAKTEKKK